MCGIAGILGSSDPSDIENMVSAMYHRGPDDKGFYKDDKISLGMSRLAILDTHPTGHQPMSTPDGKIVIVYNGELYNFKSEWKILESKGYSFRSTSDTEVVLYMYEHYGDDFLSRMEGIFSLAIYDKRMGPGNEKLFLARDQFGVKPLLYFHLGNRFIFASEMKSLLSSGMVVPCIDRNALRLLLTFGSVYQPSTLIHNVKMLLPAHAMIIKNGRITIYKYWSLKTDRYHGVRELSYEKQLNMLENILDNVVKHQMVSDVPIGAFLSGGIDSSILVSKMSMNSDHKIKTFSIGFDDDGQNVDESNMAKIISDYIGTDHSSIIVKGSDVRDNIYTIAKRLDQPSVDGINSYFVSLAASKDVTVAISGTGGDEIFAGYPWFSSMRKYKKWSLSESFRNFFDDNCGRDGFLRNFSYEYSIFSAKEGSRLLNIPNYKKCMDLIHVDELSGGTIIERVTGLVLRGYTNNQLLRDIDAVSMSHSLEVRVPYLDSQMVNFALSLPDSTKMGNWVNIDQTYNSAGIKRILADIGRKVLPVEVFDQPKRGFSMPFDTWLRGPLASVLDISLSNNSMLRKLGWVNTKELLKVKNKFYNKQIGWPRPWLLMMLKLWEQEVFDPAADHWENKNA